MRSKKVTVIVPVYNAGRWLKRCVTSVLQQSYKDLELIVVDDGSEDDSGRRADAYTAADPRARTIHIPHGGVSAARNAGLSEATGYYVIFVDADDELHPRALEIMTATASRTGADVISTPIRASLSTVFENIDPQNCRIRYYLPEEAAELHLYRKIIDRSISGKLFERALFDRNEIRSPEGLRYEDIAMSYLVYSHCRGVAHIRKRLYFNRTRSNGFLHVWTPERTDCFPVMERILEETGDNKRLNRAAADRMFFVSYNIFLLARANGETQTAEECWERVRRYRLRTILNPRTLFYNRLCALASYFGPSFAARMTRYRT